MSVVRDTVTITNVLNYTTKADGQPYAPSQFTGKAQMRQVIHFTDSQGAQRNGSLFCDVENPTFTPADSNKTMLIEISTVEKNGKVFTNIKKAAAAPASAPPVQVPSGGLPTMVEGAPNGTTPATPAAPPSQLTPIDRMLGEQLADIRDSVQSMSDAQNLLLEYVRKYVEMHEVGKVADASMEPKNGELPTIPFDEETASELDKNPQDHPFPDGSTPPRAAEPDVTATPIDTAEADQKPPDQTPPSNATTEAATQAATQAAAESGDIRPPAGW